MIKKDKLIKAVILVTLSVTALVYFKINKYVIDNQLRKTVFKENANTNRNKGEMVEKDDTDHKSKENNITTEGLEYNKGKSQMEKNLEVHKIIIDNDMDEDGILDLEDFVEGARREAKNKPIYRSKYYMGGYPSEHEGVCTDVIWRSFKNAGYNLKEMIDKDIREHTADYPRVDGRPDPNIDFRRVPNQFVFFRKHAVKITNDLKPNDAINLKKWQGGDIVVFRNPEHIAIVSDIRRKDGVPFIIHNSGPYAKEEDNLDMWMADDGIIGHFRFPKLN